MRIKLSEKASELQFGIDKHRLSFFVIRLKGNAKKLEEVRQIMKRILNFLILLTLVGKETNKLVALFWLKIDEQSESKSAKRSFASKNLL